MLEDIDNDLKHQIRAPPPEVFAQYHFVSAHLWKHQQDSEKFYRHSISYLGYSNLDTVENLKEWANDIAIAAIIAPSFYDFGELSLHPSMKKLEKTEQEWVLDILKAYINADVTTFEETMNKYQKNIENEPLLKNKQHIITEKIRLLALVRLAFDKPSLERILHFDEISKITSVDNENIEKLVMRGMSLKLIEGIIDGTEQTITINYVKPRILDINEIQNITVKMQNWVSNIYKTQNQVEPIIKQLFKN